MMFSLVNLLFFLFFLETSLTSPSQAEDFFPLRLNVYFFNITNVDDVEEYGDKPR